MQIYIYLLKGGEGFNFNKKVKRFAQDKVKYFGFKLTKNSILPADSMSESIRDFPTPKSITNASAFFSLVEQVSFKKS